MKYAFSTFFCIKKLKRKKKQENWSKILRKCAFLNCLSCVLSQENKKCPRFSVYVKIYFYHCKGVFPRNKTFGQLWSAQYPNASPNIQQKCSILRVNFNKNKFGLYTFLTTMQNYAKRLFCLTIAKSFIKLKGFRKIGLLTSFIASLLNIRKMYVIRCLLTNFSFNSRQ